ncbi:MAG: tetratricopeptide repeat protein, partial [Pseudonocardiaceae bacterium]
APAALDLLTLAAHLAPEPIPLTLFTVHPDRLPDPLATMARDPLAFTELIRLLRRGGLARVEPGSLRLHRLVQALLRGQPVQYDMPTRAVRLLRAAVPADPWGDPSTWPTWRQLLPHILATTDASRTVGPAGDDIAWLLDRTGLYLLARGEPASAQPLVERALDQYRSVLGEDHPNTLTAANTLAVDLHTLGRYEQARQLYEDTFTHRRRVLGEDHPDTLRTANNLAAVLAELGRFEQARQLDEDTYTHRRRLSGKDHPDTLVAATNLADDMHMLNYHEQARQLAEDTLTRRRQVLGKDHPNTLITANNLATYLGALNQHEQALQLDDDTLTRRRRVLGNDHPHTLLSAGNLAADLRALGRDNEASQWEEWVRA